MQLNRCPSNGSFWPESTRELFRRFCLQIRSHFPTLLRVMTLRFVLSAMLLGGLLSSAVAADKLEKRKSPKGAKAYIITPKDGKSVNKKFTVRFGLKGMGVAPATIDKENTGHHHLLIDVDKLPNLCLLYTSPSPRDQRGSRMPSSA